MFHEPSHQPMFMGVVYAIYIDELPISWMYDSNMQHLFKANVQVEIGLEW